ncbi:MAG: HEAT repeat domain-containing protein [Polyangiaceae bacterium]
MSALSERAALGDRTVIGDSAKATSADVAAFVELLRTPSWEVRELAVQCLLRVEHPNAAHALVLALDDPHFQVRGAALSGLERRAQPVMQAALFAAYDRAEDPWTRSGIARALGRVGAALDVRALRERCDREPDPVAREGCVVALARAGEPAAREQFARQLHAARGEDLLHLFEQCAYLHAPWLLPALAPLLEDETPVSFYGGHDPEGRPPGALRVCDLAVNLAQEISGAAFSFSVAPRKNYARSERAEVARFVDAMP